jgi:hypothetical protein
MPAGLERRRFPLTVEDSVLSFARWMVFVLKSLGEDRTFLERKKTYDPFYQ